MALFICHWGAHFLSTICYIFILPKTDVEDEVDNDCYCGCRDHELDRSFDNLKDHEHDRHNNDQRSETHRNYPLVKDAPEGSVSIPSTDEPNRFFSQVDRATRNPRCDF